MENEKLNIEEYVEYFHQQLEEAQVSPKQLYALVNMLLREVANTTSHFDSLAHFHTFEHEYTRNL